MSTALRRLVLLMLVAFGAAPRVFACTPVADPTTDAEYFERSKEVFRARVVAVRISERTVESNAYVFYKQLQARHPAAARRTGDPWGPRYVTEVRRQTRVEVLEVLKGSPPRFITFERAVHSSPCPHLTHEPQVGGEYLYVRGWDPKAGAVPRDPYRYPKLSREEGFAIPEPLESWPWPLSDGPQACERGKGQMGKDEYCEEQQARYAALLKLAAEAGTLHGTNPVPLSKEQWALSRYLVRKPLSADTPTECGLAEAIDNQRLDRSSFAFVAKPISVEIVDHVVRVDHRAVTKEVLQVQYRVTTRLKGNPPATFTVRSDLPGNSGCGLDFRRNRSEGRGDRSELTAFFLDQWRDFVSMAEALPMTPGEEKRWAELEKADVAERGNVCGLAGKSDDELAAMSKQIVRLEILEPCLPGGCTTQTRTKEVIKGSAELPQPLALCWGAHSVEALQNGREYVVFFMSDGPPYDGRALAAYEYAGGGASDLRTVKLRQTVAKAKSRSSERIHGAAVGLMGPQR